MIATDDPRHGTRAGYQKGCRCDGCRAASARYAKQSDLRRHRGEKLTYPAIGTQRRLQALMVIGWRAQDIAEVAGWSNCRNVADVLDHKPSSRIRAATYERVKHTYDQLSMTPGTSKVTATRARNRGWQPPLAWDDETIDNPDTGPACTEDEPIVDEVLIQRALDGIRVDASRAERKIITDRWRSSGRPMSHLDRIQGWNVHRDRRAA